MNTIFLFFQRRQGRWRRQRHMRGEDTLVCAAEASTAAAEPAPSTLTKGNYHLWSKLSTAVNVVLVATVVWFSLSSFLTASPQFTARLNDLFNSRAFQRASTAFTTLPAHNWAALEHQLAQHPWRTAAIMTGRDIRYQLNNKRKQGAGSISLLISQSVTLPFFPRQRCMHLPSHHQLVS